ncbi:MAG: HAMP domain-containing histidine kinase [Proteobacteria bacterium]|nr:HAMP domain-containing histidine kinase [Pseudomonadota bacterium]
MPERFRAGLLNAWRLVAHSLSGRLLLLTILYVMVTEVLIFVPSVGRYHRSLLDDHIETAEIAILPFTERGGEQLSAALRNELLMRAGATAVMLKRSYQRELFLGDQVLPQKIDRTIDLRSANVFTEMAEALNSIFAGGDRVLHVVSHTRITGAEDVEVIVAEEPIRRDLVQFAERTLLLALAISLVTALLVFLSLYLVLVRPMRRITHAMVTFRENPEDASRIVSASVRRDEIGLAERELAVMQRDLYGFIQQKGRLAALGAAVAKIQHDLRNILSSAQIASDRLSSVDDPVVQRLAPRLVASIDRAVALATNTLRYGRAEEHPPERRRLRVLPLVDEAAMSAVSGKTPEQAIAVFISIDPELEVDADSEQLFRIVLNLVRNASEAIGERASGEIRIAAQRQGRHVFIEVADNGPGIAQAVRARLFQPFASTAKPGGSGLGLTIARDLARAHGGDVTLTETGALGTCFRVDIPDREASG